MGADNEDNIRQRKKDLMGLLKNIGIAVNVIAVILSLISSFLMGMLGSMFIGSISDTDKMIGIICFLIIPILLAVSVLSLVFVIKKSGWIFWLCLGAGAVETAVYLAMIYFLFTAIEAAARP